jgi:PAS domain S-box-containing protein
MPLNSSWNFSFDFPLAILLTFIPSFINICIFSYISLTFPKNRINLAFAVFVLLLGLWQLTEGLMHISVTEFSSLRWYRMSGIPALAVAPLQIFIALYFTGWQKKISQSLLIICLIVPTIILGMGIAGGFDHYTLIRSELWNWIASPEHNFITVAIYLWVSFTSVVTLFIFWLYFFKGKKDEIKRKQAMVLAIGFSIPIIGGLFGEVILPIFFDAPSHPITIPLITVFSLSFLVAIKRYRLLEYSPRHQWENILNTMDEGLVIVDNNDQIVYVNRKFCELFERSPEELIGMYPDKYVTEENSNKTLKEAFSKRKENLSSHYQVQLDRKDGSRIWVSISGFPYTDKNGKVIGAVGIAADINELMVAQDKLKSKINDLNVFFYKMSHDFKTPIASMQGLLECYGQEEEANKEELMHYIKICVKNLSLIVHRVSQLSVIQQKNIIPEMIDVRSEVEAAINEIEKEIPFKQFTHVHILIDEEKIISEHFLFKIILISLIENSVKYLDTKKEFADITIAMKRNGDEYELTIRDNGEGIAPEIKGKIFDMFYRGNDKSKGAGLGLYIVKMATEKLNGKVSVDSNPNEGSTFTVTFPALKIK